MRLWAVVGIALALLLAGQSSARAAQADILCEKAPATLGPEPIPALVRDWVTITCTPRGQSLVPQVQGKAVVWRVHGAGSLFSVDALPFGRPMPPGVTSYEMRFDRFEAGERTGVEFQQTLRMWDLAFPGVRRPEIRKVVQLDARTIWNGLVFNLFFYIADEKPLWLVVCVDRCNRSVAVDIVEQP